METTDAQKQIREKVFEFYSKNKKVCDESYALAEDEKIDAIYERVQKTDVNTLLAKTAIVIITANKYERTILHKKIYSNSMQSIKQIEITLSTACDRFNSLYAYWFEWNGYSVLNIHANVTGSYTIGGAADIIRWVKANKYLWPTAIISFGVCFGTQETKCELGDVIISKKVYPYFIGVKIKGDELSVVDDNAFNLNYKWLNKLNNLIENNKFKCFDFTTRLENYITGEAVVSSIEARNSFSNITSQDIWAGDMEGYGLFKECNSSEYSLPCIIVKSICDWGSEKNFNAQNLEVLSEFEIALKLGAPTEYSAQFDGKTLLQTLKDRLQAYSASCSFYVLEVLINNYFFDQSKFILIRDWLNNYNGLATTCKSIKEKASEIVFGLHSEHSVSDSYIHQVLMIIEKEGLIHCEPECTQEEMGQVGCFHKNGNASIKIEKER